MTHFKHVLPCHGLMIFRKTNQLKFVWHIIVCEGMGWEAIITLNMHVPIVSMHFHGDNNVLQVELEQYFDLTVCYQLKSSEIGYSWNNDKYVETQHRYDIIKLHYKIDFSKLLQYRFIVFFIDV